MLPQPSQTGSWPTTPLSSCRTTLLPVGVGTRVAHSIPKSSSRRDVHSNEKGPPPDGDVRLQYTAAAAWLTRILFRFRSPLPRASANPRSSRRRSRTRLFAPLRPCNLISRYWQATSSDPFGPEAPGQSQMGYIGAHGEETLKRYRYSGQDHSVVAKYVLQPFWSRCVTLFPLWMP
ncbi:hypothetical protein GUJ93_ZPchr0006g45428 [Zizania palustris]|uniref:Uncharacterized protein n=1 Tax=Zizania palustris TaxID=103762 RepID=A0A8J5TB36_ZIZPA|nr:hypothetical protein GUJ93_ZPchr0006g45428 [Zizania palustris]